MTADTPRPTPTTQADDAQLRMQANEAIRWAKLVYVSPRRLLALLDRAEARDATGLLLCGAWDKDNMGARVRCYLPIHDGVILGHTFAFPSVHDRLAALAAAPQEPRWPSIQQLTDALETVLRTTVVVVPDTATSAEVTRLTAEGLAVPLLAALREGAERP